MCTELLVWTWLWSSMDFLLYYNIPIPSGYTVCMFLCFYVSPCALFVLHMCIVYMYASMDFIVFF